MTENRKLRNELKNEMELSIQYKAGKNGDLLIKVPHTLACLKRWYPEITFEWQRVLP
jgi:hypothetical protein